MHGASHIAISLPRRQSGESERQESSCKERQGSCVQSLIPYGKRFLSQSIFLVEDHKRKHRLC